MTYSDFKMTLASYGFINTEVLSEQEYHQAKDLLDFDSIYAMACDIQSGAFSDFIPALDYYLINL